MARIVHAQVPPKVEYHLTEWGQSLCPVLDKLLTWAEAAPDEIRERLIEGELPASTNTAGAEVCALASAPAHAA